MIARFHRKRGTHRDLRTEAELVVWQDELHVTAHLKGLSEATSRWGPTGLHTQEGYERLGRRMRRFLRLGGDMQTVYDRAAWLSLNESPGRWDSSLARIFSRSILGRHRPHGLMG